MGLTLVGILTKSVKPNPNFSNLIHTHFQPIP
jgi:hypothetical protein